MMVTSTVKAATTSRLSTASALAPKTTKQKIVSCRVACDALLKTDAPPPAGA